MKHVTRVGFIIADNDVGGHGRSAVNLATHLKEAGTEVEIAALGGPGEHMLAKSGIPYRIFPHWLERRIPHRRSIKGLVDHARKRRWDLLHAFDLPAVNWTQVAARRLGLPAVTTICGGVGPVAFPPHYPVIVYSKELRDVLRRLGCSEDEIVVEMGRMPLASLPKAEDLDELLDRLGVQEDEKVVMMGAHLRTSTWAALKCVMEAVASLVGEGLAVHLVHFGKPQHPGVGEKAREFEARLNGLLRRPFLHLCGYVPNAQGYFHGAHLVAGTGRAAFESMVLGKPVVFVGPYGFAGVMNEEGLEDVAYYNFSGRNARTWPEEKRNWQALAGAMRRLLTEDEYARECGAFGKQWVRQVSAEHAVPVYQRVYEEALAGSYRLAGEWSLRSFYTRLVLQKGLQRIGQELGGLWARVRPSSNGLGRLDKEPEV